MCHCGGVTQTGSETTRECLGRELVVSYRDLLGGHTYHLYTQYTRSLGTDLRPCRLEFCVFYHLKALQRI